MQLQLLGLKEEASVEVSLDFHSLAAYLGFPPREGTWQGFSLAAWDSTILWGKIRACSSQA